MYLRPHFSLPDSLPNINDSKQLTEEDRQVLYDALLLAAADGQLEYSVHVQSHERIDEINVLQATLESMTICSKLVMEKIRSSPSSPLQSGDFKSVQILIDGPHVPKPKVHHSSDLVNFLENAQLEPVVRGDATVYCIAAASILAKVTRDHIMNAYEKQFPGYGFAQHKGYGVPNHMAAISKLGPCKIHRWSFAPMKHMKKK